MVILAGTGDHLILALRFGVVSAHHTLKLWKLADNFSKQISLGKKGRTLDFAHVRANQRRNHIPG